MMLNESNILPNVPACTSLEIEQSGNREQRFLTERERLLSRVPPCSPLYIRKEIINNNSNIGNIETHSVYIQRGFANKGGTGEHFF